MMYDRLGRILVSLWLLALPITVLAKDDSNYSPAQNFRPENVTGLGDLYAAVGS